MSHKRKRNKAARKSNVAAPSVPRRLRRVQSREPTSAPRSPPGADVTGAMTPPPAPFDPGLEEPAASRSGVHVISPKMRVEHRAHARVAVAVNIGMETSSHFFSGLAGDLSEGGVFVQTYRDLPVGSEVEVSFALPLREFTAHGCVRWHRAGSDSSPPGVGISFEALHAEDREAIQAFCRWRAPLYYDAL
jgi:uncharacterized protein (TIGR02266 family)